MNYRLLGRAGYYTTADGHTKTNSTGRRPVMKRADFVLESVFASSGPPRLLEGLLRQHTYLGSAMATPRPHNARPRPLRFSKSHGSPTAGNPETSSAQSAGLNVGAALNRQAAGGSTSGMFLPERKLRMDAAEGKENDSRLPLEVIVRRCVREPVFAQCRAIDSAALVYLVRDAGVAEHLASMRMFLLGLGSNFLHDFTLRLLDGLYDGG